MFMRENLTPAEQAVYDSHIAAGPDDPAQAAAFDVPQPAQPRPERRPINIDLAEHPTIDDPSPDDLGQPIAGIQCAVNQDTVTALQHYMATQGVELHEALARLVQMGDVMYRQLSDPDNTAWVVRGLPAMPAQVHRGLGAVLRHLGALEIRLGP
jgi:hypothetical protein